MSQNRWIGHFISDNSKKKSKKKKDGKSWSILIYWILYKSLRFLKNIFKQKWKLNLKWDIQRKNSKTNNKRAYSKELIIIIIIII